MTRLTAGKILRRGTGGLNPVQFKELLDNSDKVQAILDEIEARRAVFIETEQDAKARVDAAEKAAADLAERADRWFNENPLPQIQEH